MLVLNDNIAVPGSHFRVCIMELQLLLTFIYIFISLLVGFSTKNSHWPKIVILLMKLSAFHLVYGAQAEKFALLVQMHAPIVNLLPLKMSAHFRTFFCLFFLGLFFF